MDNGRRKFLKTLGAGAAAVTLGRRTLRGNPLPASIRFWDMRVGPAGIYPKAGQQLVSRYNEQNPGVHVSYETQDWSDWPQLFSLALLTQTAPDLSTGGSYQALQYYDKGAILELDDVVADLKASGEDKDFLPGTLESAVYKGHTIALPWAIDLRLIYYRKDLFAKAGIGVPGSWSELRAAAKALTGNGHYGVVVAGKGLSAMHTLFLLMLNNGGGLFTPDGQIQVMDARNVEAFEFFSDLVKDGSMNPSSAGIVAEDAESEFMAGRGAILFGAMGLQTIFPDQLDKIGVLPPPEGPHGDKGTISWTPNIMLYKPAQNAEAAKKFLKWWSANEKPMWTEGQCSRLPVRASIAADPCFQNDPITKQILEQWVPVGKSAGSHKLQLFPMLNDLEGNGPLMILAHDLLRGKDTVSSMQTADRHLQALMKYGGSY